eukprot:TRINITY_DN12580_c0_g1_i1.p4 TRINITY_DN12580_c0_g1~~TRINITY_DN12580_c0_g1_i1.p4  ORF type:complete len:119 (+),score=25.08 TRINITY_DN12580_c0_g1_i1:314-670(+)
MPDVCVIKVEVICGSKLISMDVNGLSDPYCEVVVEGKPTQKTKVQHGTLDPVWNQVFTYTFSYEHMPEQFSFFLYDHDLVGKDDPMGWCASHWRMCCGSRSSYWTSGLWCGQSNRGTR